MTVREARNVIEEEETKKLIDSENVVEVCTYVSLCCSSSLATGIKVWLFSFENLQQAIKSVEDDGIVFIDEIDKICAHPR